MRILLIITLILCGCQEPKQAPPRKPLAAAPAPVTPAAKPPPVSQPLGLNRKFLEGRFFYLKSIVESTYPSPEKRLFFPGVYLESDRIIQFSVKDELLDVNSAIPVFDEKTKKLRGPNLAAFALKQRKPNILDPNEFEINVCSDPYDEIDSRPGLPLSQKVSIASPDLLNLTCEKRYSDGTTVTVRHSFLRYEESDYKGKEYPRFLEGRFGFFKTELRTLDPVTKLPGIVKTFLNRWDLRKPIRFYFSKNFPEPLKEPIRKSVAAWNEVILSVTKNDPAITKKDPFEVLDNSGQEPGSLGSNMIVYSDHPTAEHPVLGHAPTTVDPESGRFVKGDLFVFSTALESSIKKVRRIKELWARPFQLKDPSHNLSDVLDHPKESKDEKLPENIYTDAFNKIDLAAANRASGKRGRFTTFLDAETVMAFPFDLVNSAIEDGLLAQKVIALNSLHEFGHVLGLRHNFEGSFDDDSSVMDYSFQRLEGPAKPGKYDIAAIEYGYGDTPVLDLLNRNLLYCTDDDLNQSRKATCSRFDKGTTLLQLLEHHRKRYLVNSMANLDDEENDDSPLEYAGKVGKLMMPIRHLHDFSDAIRRGFETRQHLNLWQILGQKIEKGPTTKQDDEILLPVEATGDKDRRIIVDEAKLKKYAELAGTVRDRSGFTLFEVILAAGENPKDLSEKALADKMAGLYMITHLLPDPLLPKRKINFFDTFSTGTLGLFERLISNTTSTLIRAFYPSDVRDAAINTFLQLSKPSAPKALLRDFIQVGTIDANNALIEDQKLFVQISEFTSRILNHINQTALTMTGSGFGSIVNLFLREDYGPLYTERIYNVTRRAGNVDLMAFQHELGARIAKALPSQNHDTKKLLDIESLRVKRRTLYRKLYENKYRGIPPYDQLRGIDLIRDELGLIQESYCHLQNNVYLKARRETPGLRVSPATWVFIRYNLNVVEDQLIAMYELLEDIDSRLKRNLPSSEVDGLNTLKKRIESEIEIERPRYYYEKDILQKLSNSFQ